MKSIGSRLTPARASDPNGQTPTGGLRPIASTDAAIRSRQPEHPSPLPNAIHWAFLLERVDLAAGFV